MYEPHHPHYHRSPRRKSNLASCIIASVFLLFLITVAVTVFFFLFKPKPPKIAVDAVQFPAFSVSNGTFNFTFFQFLSVTNPNRDSFSHYDSSLQLVYSGSQVGVVFIPAGEIGGGRTQKMSAKFEVKEYPLGSSATTAGGVTTAATAAASGGAELGEMMEIETRMKLEGRVRVLRVFTHRVENGVKCSVAIQTSTGSVLGFHC